MDDRLVYVDDRSSSLLESEDDVSVFFSDAPSFVASSNDQAENGRLGFGISMTESGDTTDILAGVSTS